jgi:diguanylate cyclase (GGDEF)-like protein
MPFFRYIAARYRVWQIVVMVTLISMLLSVAIQYLLAVITGDDSLYRYLWVGFLIPALIAPGVTYGFAKLLRELRDMHRELRKLARLDDLTGVYNRRYFEEQVEHHLRLSDRSREPLVLMMIDADDFKAINDTYGHLNGDLVIKRVAQACAELIRDTDLICRYGGEEFQVLLVGCDARRGMAKAETLRQAISNMTIESDRGDIDVTVSIGLAEVSEGNPGLETLMTMADRALYRAKDRGKNCCELYQ